MYKNIGYADEHYFIQCHLVKLKSYKNQAVFGGGNRLFLD